MVFNFVNFYKLALHKMEGRRNGKLTLVFSQMYGGKTTYLVHIADSMGRVFPVLYINHSIDTRSTGNISTHSKIAKEDFLKELNVTSLKVSSLADVPHELVQKHRVICVDEGQFFKDVCEVVPKWVDGLKKEVYVSGLNGDSNRKVFGKLPFLLPLVDDIVKLKDTFCSECAKQGIAEKAVFTHCTVEKDKQIEVGADIYIPVCRGCYLDLNSQ